MVYANWHGQWTANTSCFVMYQNYNKETALHKYFRIFCDKSRLTTWIVCIYESKNSNDAMKGTEEDFLILISFGNNNKSKYTARESIIESLNIVKWRLKARIMEQEKLAVARQRLGKDVCTATNKHVELEDAVFSIWYAPRL